jgi:hypothetical protein
VNHDRFIETVATTSFLIAGALLGYYSQVQHVAGLDGPPAFASARAPTPAPTRFVVDGMGPDGACEDGIFVLHERTPLAKPPSDPRGQMAAPMIPVECAHPQARLSVEYAGATAWAFCTCPKINGRQ